MFHNRQGQALYEYILALPVFALLLLFVGAFAWYWWNARHEAHICNV